MHGCEDCWIRFLSRLKLGFLGNSCVQNHIERNNATNLFLVEFLWVENFGLREEVQAIVIELDLFVIWETFLIKDLFNTSDYENSHARNKVSKFSIDWCFASWNFQAEERSRRHCLWECFIRNLRSFSDLDLLGIYWYQKYDTRNVIATIPIDWFFGKWNFRLRCWCKISTP